MPVPETDATAVQSVDRTAKEKSCAVDPTEVSTAGHALQQPPRSYKSVRLPWIGLIFMCKASTESCSTKSGSGPFVVGVSAKIDTMHALWPNEAA